MQIFRKVFAPPTCKQQQNDSHSCQRDTCQQIWFQILCLTNSLAVVTAGVLCLGTRSVTATFHESAGDRVWDHRRPQEVCSRVVSHAPFGYFYPPSKKRVFHGPFLKNYIIVSESLFHIRSFRGEKGRRETRVEWTEFAWCLITYVWVIFCFVHIVAHTDTHTPPLPPIQKLRVAEASHQLRNWASSSKC